MWTEVRDQEQLKKALKLAKGSYQVNLLKGLENLSGSTLTGSARNQYGFRYELSRRNLLSRLRSNGIKVSERRGSHNKRILVIG